MTKQINGRMIMSVMLCLASLTAPVASAQDNNNQAVSASDLDALKQRIAAQQEQIKKLQQAMDEQQKLLERSLENLSAKAAVVATAKTADGTSVTAVSNANSDARLIPAMGGRNQTGKPEEKSGNPCEGENVSPTFLRIGNTCVVPIGFMDLTAVWRDKNAGSSIGSNFGSVPLNNSANAQNSEFRFTIQNSRIGFRVDGDWKGTHFIGYNELDFLGTSGSTNLGVSNSAFVPRLRLFWVDARKGKLEFLAGQSWSMLTPNRSGISALPGDLFYSHVVDVNYMPGLTWTRQSGVRVLYHPSKKATFGLSFENPDQYIGGSAGGSSITLPSASTLSGLAGTQLDNASNTLATPTVAPDIIAKLALDPSSRLHFEVAGIERNFKVWNPGTGTALGAGQHFSATGAGVQVGINAAVTKNFRLISTNYWSDGGGRYLFGQAPDLIVRSNGSLSLIHAGGTVDGFEATIKKTLLYAYYGGIYIGRNTALDTTGKPIGFGYAGSGNQNRAIQEGTFGFNQTLWKNPKYGAINLMGQYEYLSRSLWSFSAGQAGGKGTHDNTAYFNMRYTLPGGMPNF